MTLIKTNPATNPMREELISKGLLIEVSNSANLIPVHINKMRDKSYFYDWSSDLKGWFRGDEIPEKLKRMYKTPLVKSNYM
jgi:hypothetical protein